VSPEWRRSRASGIAPLAADSFRATLGATWGRSRASTVGRRHTLA